MQKTLVYRNVLVLNQSYEPLLICDVKRAIVLVIQEKASIVKAVDDVMLRTVSDSYPVPSIIRIQRYIRINQWMAILNKNNIFKRDNYTCQYCGARNVPLTIDHVVPRVKGGGDTWNNLVTACHQCNNRKGHKPLKEVGMVLLRRPKKPHRIHTLQRYARSVVNEWRPFLFLD